MAPYSFNKENKMAKTDYPHIISKTIEAMINSSQRVFLAVELARVIRSNHPSLSYAQSQTALRKLKEDSCIKVTKVSKTKQYISYQGIV